MQFTLEILRAAQADDPFAFRVGLQEYVLRTRLGGVETAVLDWDEAFLGELAALRLPGRDPELVQRVGDRLRRFLSTTRFSQREAELVAAVARGEPVQLTLRLAAAELYALPWELLTLGSGRHLGELVGVTLRYAWPETETAPEVPAPRPEGGRVLVAWSAAAGVVPAREHVLAIERACRLGHHPFDPARDVLPHVTLERLGAALDAAERDGPVAVLHILCHGARHKASFGLAWNREAGAPGGDGPREAGGEAGDGVHIVDAAQLRQLLQPHAGRLRLVVLCACDSANSGQLGSHLGGVAQALHRVGLAAVVASRYPLSSAGSVQLTEALYGALLGQPASLEAALGAARQRLRLHGLGSLDWASLQLYARPEDGEDSRPLVVRPYRGLSPFLMHHSRFFFGRERERQVLRASLDELAASGQPRLVVVAGASGSGKSSLVLGGLIPDLAAAALPTGTARLIEARRVLGELVRLLGEHGSTGALHTALGALQSELAALPEDSSGPWEWAVLRPGGDPLGALERALRTRRDPSRPFLLCVDQLEELVTRGLSVEKTASEGVGERWGNEFLHRLTRGLPCLQRSSELL